MKLELENQAMSALIVDVVSIGISTRFVISTNGRNLAPSYPKDFSLRSK